MTLAGNLTALVYVGWIVLLGICSAVLLYLLHYRSDLLMYPGALKALTASLLLGVVGTALETAYWAGFGGSTLHLAAWLVIFVGGSVFTGAMWLFTRDVLTVDHRNTPFENYPVSDTTATTDPTNRDDGGDDVRNE